MKKLITIILILALFLPAAALADLPDISALTEAELIELNHQIQLMLFSQKLVDGVTVPAGEYIVGEDVPEGVYRVEVVYKSAGGTLFIFDKADDSMYSDQSYLGEFWGVEEIGKLTLKAGNKIKISTNALKFFPYVGLFN